MAKHTVRLPQKGDRVGAIGREGVFVVIGVHENPNMADLRPLKGGPLQKGIPWRTLTFLDEEGASPTRSADRKRSYEKVTRFQAFQKPARFHLTGRAFSNFHSSPRRFLFLLPQSIQRGVTVNECNGDIMPTILSADANPLAFIDLPPYQT